MKICIAQTNIKWESVDENLSFCAKKLATLPADVQLVIFPEMFSTGFSMNSEKIAQPMSGRTVSWIKEKALEHNLSIIAGVAIEEDGKYFNRLIWCDPNGNLKWYDKRHLFRIAGEQKSYDMGNSKLLVECEGFRIALFVCYDLRFPIWSRNVVNNNGTPDFEYDMAVYIANWPEARSYQWSTLLKARAIENECFVAGVNRVGTDAKGHSYSGNSVVLGPAGELIGECMRGMEDIKVINLDKEKLLNYRKKFPFILDADL